MASLSFRPRTSYTTVVGRHRAVSGDDERVGKQPQESSRTYANTHVLACDLTVRVHISAVDACTRVRVRVSICMTMLYETTGGCTTITSSFRCMLVASHVSLTAACLCAREYCAPP